MELFKAGDWVVWRFKPLDPDGSWYNSKNHWVYHTPGHVGETDTIDRELRYFEPPPYEVCYAFELEDEFRKTRGHPQVLIVRMFPDARKLAMDPAHPNPDLRQFSGMLFKKASFREVEVPQ